MPANIVLRDLTNPPKKGNTSPIIATRADLRDGVRGNSGVSNPPGETGVSFAFGDSALGGSVENGVLTITTDGALDFGAVGPEPIILASLDASAGYLKAADIRVGAGATIDPSNTDLFEVVEDPLMPFGKGWKMGGTESGQNPTSTQRLWVDHPAYSRIFESRITYWPATQQENSIPLLDGNAVWGMKPIWNMADRHFGNEKTNFFWGANYGWYASGQYFTEQSAISTNLAGKTTYFNGASNQNPGDTPLLRPHPTPYIISTLWDQGSLTPGTADSTVKTLSTRVGAGQSFDVARNDLQLFGVGGDADRFNSFSYPGYIRGFSVGQNMHLLEGELYKTGGPGAARAVIISDNAYFKLATRYTFQWVTAETWSNSQIVADLRAGFFDLSNRSGLYLNITDENFEQIGSRPL
jgi:hypothetical protein